METIKNLTTQQLIEAFIQTIKNLTTQQLIEAFIQTGKDESGDPEIYTVRGWLESEEPEDEDLPKYFN